MAGLAHDACRCHDACCAKRYLCARWVEREQGGPRTPHSWSLYQVTDEQAASLALSYPVPCDYYLEAPYG